jgi:hypothetical protein
MDCEPIKEKKKKKSKDKSLGEIQVYPVPVPFLSQKAMKIDGTWYL